MRNFFSKISNWVKTHLDDIILVVGVILISLLSFVMGYIAAKHEEKEPIRIEKHENSNHWGGNKRTLSVMETFRKGPQSNGF